MRCRKSGISFYQQPQFYCRFTNNNGIVTKYIESDLDGDHITHHHFTYQLFISETNLHITIFLNRCSKTNRIAFFYRPHFELPFFCTSSLLEWNEWFLQLWAVTVNLRLLFFFSLSVLFCSFGSVAIVVQLRPSTSGRAGRSALEHRLNYWNSVLKRCRYLMNIVSGGCLGRRVWEDLFPSVDIRNEPKGALSIACTQKKNCEKNQICTEKRDNKKKHS